jgi:Flp pilus assembly pilin Flp
LSLARLDDEGGQTYVEYALILAAIASIVLAGWTNLDGAINAAIANVVNALGA